ncbi:hypothetical protein Anapl_03892 [Anas platyrhynchos]|uniref:Uncharacterized protein n=1 Tax=Anas platyrhynchos TaxID=8839 RepID=R0JGD6_ANAPL|nr:hypothetical protein Anapl_03892 [Anas platyrhynchos]
MKYYSHKLISTENISARVPNFPSNTEARTQETLAASRKTIGVRKQQKYHGTYLTAQPAAERNGNNALEAVAEHNGDFSQLGAAFPTRKMNAEQQEEGEDGFGFAAGDDSSIRHAPHAAGSRLQVEGEIAFLSSTRDWLHEGAGIQQKYLGTLIIINYEDLHNQHTLPSNILVKKSMRTDVTWSIFGTLQNQGTHFCEFNFKGNLDEVFVGYQSYVRDAPAKQKALRVPQLQYTVTRHVSSKSRFLETTQSVRSSAFWKELSPRFIAPSVSSPEKSFLFHTSLRCRSWRQAKGQSSTTTGASCAKGSVSRQYVQLISILVTALKELWQTDEAGLPLVDTEVTLSLDIPFVRVSLRLCCHRGDGNQAHQPDLVCMTLAEIPEEESPGRLPARMASPKQAFGHLPTRGRCSPSNHPISTFSSQGRPTGKSALAFVLGGEKIPAGRADSLWNAYFQQTLQGQEESKEQKVQIKKQTFSAIQKPRAIICLSCHTHQQRHSGRPVKPNTNRSPTITAFHVKSGQAN